MIKTTEKYNWIIFFIAGLMTSVSIILYSKTETELFPDTWPFFLLPGIIFAAVLAFKITKIIISRKKFVIYIITIILSMVASYLSVIVFLYFGLGGLFGPKTGFNNEYFAVIISGLTGGIIVSLIPNTILRTIRLTILTLLTVIASIVCGLLLLVFSNINEYGICVGYGLWFSIVGVLILKNYDRLVEIKQVSEI